MRQTVCESIKPCLRSFHLALLEEVKACFQYFNESNGQGRAGTTGKVNVVNLISVGGLQAQDLPMSGDLRASSFLQNSSNLQALLSCFIESLGRVYLVQPLALNQTDSVMYQNPSHKLFYQTFYFDLDRLATDQPESTIAYLSKDLPSSSFYLAVEIANLDNNSTVCSKDIFDEYKLQKLVLRKDEKQLILNIASVQLDILSAAQIEQGLSTIMALCHEFLNEFDRHALQQASQNFINEWKEVFSQFERDYNGEWSYQSALNRFCETFMRPVTALMLKMSYENQQEIKQALDIITFQLNLIPPTPQRINRKTLIKSQQRKSRDTSQITELPRFDRPVFIVSAPRSGSTLLFETLAQFKGAWSTGEENHAQLEAIKGLHPRDNEWHSNRLDAGNVNEVIKYDVIKMFVAQLQNKQHQHFLSLPEDERPASIRFIEKTPKNALRIPFIKTLFPDALFIYLHREAKSNISSLIDGWRSQRFTAYRDLPEYAYRHWSFLLIPGWREMLDYSMGEIATKQWQLSNWTIQDDLAKLPSSDWMELDYQKLIDFPRQSIETICQFADFEWDAGIEARCQDKLPVSRLTLSSPQKDKWLKHESLMGSSFYTRSKYRTN